MVLQRVQREVFPTEMACLERKTRFVRRVQAPYQAAPPIFTPTTREVSPLSNAPLCIRQFRLTPSPLPHSKCTNDPAAPHYEHEDIR
ncbi:unnamed protein product [Gadus morhua 'NCC']